MTEEQKTEISGLWEKTAAAREALDLDRLEMLLARYQEFVLGMRDGIAAGIYDYKSFCEFRERWKECGKIQTLPKELTAWGQYLSLANAYNAILIPELLNGGKVTEFAPVLFTQEELDIMAAAGEVYRRPFNWERMKARLVGEGARRAVYMRAAAVLEPEEFIRMVDNGEIRMETLESLPFAAGRHDICGDEDAGLAEDYGKHLAEIYRHYGKQLPAPVTETVPVRGVSFENRPQKLNYLIRWARSFCQTDSAKFSGNDAAEINRKVVIGLEKYIYHNQQENTDEPAVRVLATLIGDNSFVKMDIGNLPKEVAMRIDAECPDATLSAELEEIGVASVTGNGGTEARPYVKLALTTAGAPREIEHASGKNRGAEVDDLFNEELR